MVKLPAFLVMRYHRALDPRLMDIMNITLFFFYILRLCACVLPGYIHPDEYFQGGQELWFATNNNVMNNVIEKGISRTINDETVIWEYKANNAIRSILPPYAMTLFPLKIYIYILNLLKMKRTYYLTGYEILVIPRLFLHMLSFISFDFCLWKLLNNIKKEEQNSAAITTSIDNYLWILSSSWSFILFSCRPFSNTLEASILSFLLVLISNEFSGDNKNYCSSYCKLILMGALSAIGIFIRFTFIFFAATPILFLLYHKSTSSNTNYFYSILSTILFLSTGFIPICIICIYSDYSFYQNQIDTNDDNSIFSFITPFNALAYNTKINNLSNHGIHSRITHLFVNLPMLYGPLAFIFYFHVFQKVRRFVLYIVKKKKSTYYYDTTMTQTMCFYAIVSSLFILSCAPHQEPRFLLPTLLPFIILYSPSIITSTTTSSNTNKTFKYLQRRLLLLTWILFNLMLGAFFGYLHQSGIIPSLLYLQSLDYDNTSTSAPPNAIIYYRTYMPPTFLLSNNYDFEYAGSYNYDDINNRIKNYVIPKVVDLKGSDHILLNGALSNYLSCQTNTYNNTKNTNSKDNSYLYLVAPITTTTFLTDNDIYNQYSIQSMWEYHPHLTTEDFPSFEHGFWYFWDNLKLVTYKVQCIDS